MRRFAGRSFGRHKRLQCAATWCVSIVHTKSSASSIFVISHSVVHRTFFHRLAFLCPLALLLDDDVLPHSLCSVLWCCPSLQAQHVPLNVAPNRLPSSVFACSNVQSFGVSLYLHAHNMPVHCAISAAVFRVSNSTRPEDNVAHNSAHDSLALYCEKSLDILPCSHLFRMECMCAALLCAALCCMHALPYCAYMDRVI